MSFIVTLNDDVEKEVDAREVRVEANDYVFREEREIVAVFNRDPVKYVIEKK